MTAPITDQVAWIKFHLGDGTTPDGTRILPKETLDQMKVATIETPGSTIGDAIATSWVIKDIDGVHVIGHGGTTIGQESAFEMVPSKGLGVAVLTNASGGSDLHQAVVRAVLKEYAGLTWTDPVPADRPAESLAEYAGTYGNISITSDVRATDAGMEIESVPTQTFLDMLGATLDAFRQPPVPIKMIGDEGDRFVAVEGGKPGHSGYFRRGADGRVDAMHFGGRLSARQSD